MKEIKLTRGYVALVDDEDYERMSKYNWHYCQGYAYRTIRLGYKKRAALRMHTVINNTPDGFQTDHVNRNRLDNRKENLRTCTHKENTRNAGSWGKTSKYKGVNFKAANKKWQVQIMVNYKKMYLGLFECEIQAAKIYNKAALKYFGEYACLNEIPEDGYREK